MQFASKEWLSQYFTDEQIENILYKEKAMNLCEQVNEILNRLEKIEKHLMADKEEEIPEEIGLAEGDTIYDIDDQGFMVKQDSDRVGIDVCDFKKIRQAMNIVEKIRLDQ